jgi:hypothetical protein
MVLFHGVSGRSQRDVVTAQVFVEDNWPDGNSVSSPLDGRAGMVLAVIFLFTTRYKLLKSFLEQTSGWNVKGSKSILKCVLSRIKDIWTGHLRSDSEENQNQFSS